MKASETSFQSIIEGTKQYLVPLFQRPYSWEQKQWNVLWQDLIDLTENEQPRTHFIGSIVTMQAISVPEGVTKYLLIDGQQRLTTLFILMTAIRDCAREFGNIDLAEEVHQTMLVNHFKRGIDKYRLNPTQIDRPAYQALIDQQPQVSSKITDCYKEFRLRLTRQPDLVALLKNVVSNRLSIVSIVLDRDDNPHLVFESLNAKGSPLTQADLIRNYFLMRVHTDQQEEVYRTFWEPMQSALNSNLTEFIRHYLMRDGAIVKIGEVYFALKERIENPDQAFAELQRLKSYSVYYHRFIDPSQEPDDELRGALARLKRIEVTTAYPFLLNCYEDYAQKQISQDQLLEILRMLENYLIRRFVCNRRSSDLNKIFPQLYRQALGENLIDRVDGVRKALATRGYPSDREFYDSLLTTRIYGTGEKQQKAKFLLETVECAYQHKEVVSFDELTIEHVLPQTPTEWWKSHLGEDWEIDHDILAHTLGNLTLTGYNSEMSNRPFPDKRDWYELSHVELNRYFADISVWRKQEIEKRAEILARQCLKIWAFFGDRKVEESSTDSVRGRIPNTVYVLGEAFRVDSWVGVYATTLDRIAYLEPDKFAELASKHPNLISIEPRFRRNRQLSNGYYVELNRSANDIYRFCRYVIDFIGLSDEDWNVEIE